MDPRAVPFSFSHSPRSPRPSFWKGALQWVPAWSLEQLAAFSPGLRGTRAQLWVVRGREVRVGRRSWGFRLEPALEPELLSFPESSLGWGVWGVFQPGLGDLAGMEMLESPRRLGTLASIHVLIFRPAIFL